MDNSLFLQHLREASLDEGRSYIQEHWEELADYAAIGEILADEALKYLFNPFLSLKLAELLTFFGEFAHDLYSHALGLKAKGDAFVQIRHLEAAIQVLDEAGEKFLHLSDKRNWARSRISWIIAAASSGRVEEALQHAANAREVFQELGEPYWVCLIDHNTAWIYRQIGRYRDALVLYARMLDIYPTVTDQGEAYVKRAIAMAKESQVVILSWLGDFERARDLQQEVLATFSALTETDLTVNAIIELAELDYAQGYYGSALRQYYQAQDMFIEGNMNNPRVLAELKLKMADTLVKLSRANEAYQLAAEAVAIYRQLGESLDMGNVLSEYATALVASGRFSEAITTLNEAKILFDRGGFDHHSAVTRLHQAELLLEVGLADQAYHEAYKIKAYFEAHSLVARCVCAELVMAGSQIKRFQQNKARQDEGQEDILQLDAVALCKQAIMQASLHQLREEIYRSHHLLGQIYVEHGDEGKARRHFKAAIAQVEGILDDLAFELSPSFLHRAWKVYEDMVVLCLRQGRIEGAFQYLERARSVSLRQHLRTKQTQFERKERKEKSPPSPQLEVAGAEVLRMQQELKLWQTRYHNYSNLLTQIDFTVSPAVERGIIEAELKHSETKLNELFERLDLQRATSGHTKLKRIRTSLGPYLDTSQLCRGLSPDQLMLAYFLHEESFVIFAITNDGFRTYENANGAQQLRHMLPLLHAHLEPRGWPDLQRPPLQGIQNMLHALYSLLIAPVRDVLPAHSGLLTIVPYGPLHLLPFHALYNGTRYLIEDYQINYLPTGGLLQASAGVGHVAREGRDQTLVSATIRPPLVFGYSDRGQLQRALEESRTLAALMDGRCYLEEEATITRLIEEAPSSPIIHLATHGYSRLDAPNFSSVLLADGRFNAIDASDLNLQACELVTLSGCETGLALSGGGDEQLGLGRAFLAAGADSLVMSLWSVEDDSTSELMQGFYEHLLTGESKSAALRAAQCNLLERTNSAYTHPFFWAAFRLVGAVNPLKYTRGGSSFTTK
jgi:CHAT domain-containing protein